MGGWYGRPTHCHIPCVGKMAVERCLGYFVILACSRDVLEKFSYGTSLNKLIMLFGL